MNKIVGKIIYYGSMIIGGCISLFGEDKTIPGLLTIFIGGFIGIFVQISNEDYYTSTHTSSESKKPYYKNEFEEYQHYKFVKKHMK